MNPLDTEPQLALTDVPRIIGRKVHLNTLHRWAIRGVRGHKLRTRLIGGRRFTTASWVAEFLAAINGEKPPPIQRPDIAARCRAAGV